MGIMMGCLIFGGCSLTVLTGTQLVNFYFGLILLGLGWNFCYIGGSRLLVEAHTVAEAPKVQALNEFVIQIANAGLALSAGPMLNRWDWSGVCWVGVPPVLLTLGLSMVWSVWRRRYGLS